MIDIHTHILYNVDDGIETLEESLEMLKKYKDSGVRYIIATPHIGHPKIKTDIDVIQQNFEILRLEAEKFGVKLFLGSELYLLPGRNRKYIPILDRFVLVEFDTLNFPLYLFNEIFELQLSGYDVILAHVERYEWLNRNDKVIDKLKSMNVYFQMNFESIENDKYFLKNGYIDFLATDNHGKKRSEIDWSVFKKYNSFFENTLKIMKLKD